MTTEATQKQLTELGKRLDLMDALDRDLPELREQLDRLLEKGV